MQAAKQRRLRELSFGLGALVVAILTVVAIVWVNIDNMQMAGRQDADAREELAWADAVSDAVDDQQNALNGLASTHDLRFLPPYQEGRERFERALERLTAFAVDDSPEERHDVEEITRLARGWTHSTAEPLIASVRAGRLSPVAAGGDTSVMDEIHRSIVDLRAREGQLLGKRNRQLAAAYTTSRVALIVGSIAALAFALLIIGRTAWQLINERRTAEDAAETLAKALDRAQAAERAKTRFLGNMSHEMRTPLNGVAGMTEALAHTRLDLKQRELVDAIRFSSVTLDQLIGDLLALSGDGELGANEHAKTPFNLRAAVFAIGRPFVAQARAKGLGLEVDANSDTDVDVVGDAGGFSQLLGCLLSNAVKFTDRGRVTLTVRRLADQRYRFEVADTGVGFDEARKSQLFETFSQSDESDTRRHSGAGLGLALAGRLARAMGGALDAHSTLGEGSVFAVEVELTAVGREAVAPTVEDVPTAEAAMAPEGDEALRLLIVDDNSTNRKVLELICDQLGFTWFSVENGREAVEAARHQDFAAILMDIQMPVMDGLAATREIRRQEREMGRPMAPVIIVSASCQPDQVEAGRAAGAQRHLGKPVSVQMLVNALNGTLGESTRAA